MIKFKNLTSTQKITIVCICLMAITLVSISIPTFTRFQNRIIIENKEWDGLIADGFNSGTGTIDDPYIIASPKELAYLADTLKTTTYKDKYFKLVKNIVLNRGLLEYKENNYLYSIDGKTYYIKGNSYYEDNTYNTLVGDLNILPSLNNFEGNFDGNFFNILGLYQSSDVAGLFTNLKGSVSNLYMDNTLLVGNSIVGGISSNSSGASISNVLFKGSTISLGKTSNKDITLNIGDISTSNTLKEESYPINVELPRGSSNVKYRIKGTYSLTPAVNGIIKINDTLLTDGAFDIDLGLSNTVKISVTTDTEAVLSFKDVVVSVSYDYGVSGGIVGILDNSSISNSINKGQVYSTNVAGGLVGSVLSSSISSSYNEGLSSSLKYNGSIGLVSGNVSIDRVYNEYKGIDFIGGTSDATLNISNSFNSSDKDTIKEVSNTNLTVVDSYVLDDGVDSTDKFIRSTSQDLISNWVSTKYLEFTSYKDLTINRDNIWVLSSNYPKLYIDDINNPYVKLKVNNYIYNDYSDTFSSIVFNSDISIDVLKKDLTSNYKVYYYIGDKVLSIKELDSITEFKEYTSGISITDNKKSIIYIKVVNESNEVSYINSDILTLDKNLKPVNIYLDGKYWNTLNDIPNTEFISDTKYLDIKEYNELGLTKSIEYYLSDKVLSSSDLDNVVWTLYQGPIVLDTLNKYILYSKITDINDQVRYINTDYIVYDGYKVNMSTSINNISSNHLSITDKSYIKYEFIYDNTFNSEFIGNMSLVSNTLLPTNTKITLSDIINNKVYEYLVDNANDYGYNTNNKYATYKFNLFKEIGTTSIKKFDEIAIPLKESYKIKLDFSNTLINSDIKNIGINLVKNKDLVKLNTLSSEEKYFDIYKDNNFTQYLNISGIKDIIFNTTSDTVLNITSGITYKKIDDKDIIDTNNEGMRQGIMFKLLDKDSNEVIDNTLFKNMLFTMDGTTYTVNDSNRVLIPISDNLNEVSKSITIKTLISNDQFIENNYKIVVSNFISYDGYTGIIENTNPQEIPLVVKNSNYGNTNYEFDVQLASDKRVLNKTTKDTKRDFSITLGGINNPSIKVSLYRKKELTAYNQDYIPVDLQTHITDKLTVASESKYLVPLDNKVFSLNFISEKLLNTGYKLVFTLYDNEKEVTSVTHKLIVR